MVKMHLIMPMAGGGTRFSQTIRSPKPLIKLQGKPFFYWSSQSALLLSEVIDIRFIVLEDHINKYQIDDEIRIFYPDAKINAIPEVLNGPVLTCIRGVEDIKDDAPILFNDCDHAFLVDPIAHYFTSESEDAALLTFNSNSSNYSYVRFDDKHRFAGTVEKKVVSNEAICGAYYFKNKNTFIDAANVYIRKQRYSEFYMSGIFDELLNQGKCVSLYHLLEHISFGTPEEYELAKCDSRLIMISRGAL